ncbi:MAG: NAAT family transporter [Lentisphaeria bacterium]|nr:NAAT family transporter [Lentisphaeria bacterium]
MIPLESCIGVFVKIFVLLTPFFILSVFLAMTGSLESKERRYLAKRTTFAIWVICMVIYLFGERIFHYLGITPEAFQAGTGVMLLLSGIELVRGTSTSSIRSSSGSSDIAVVPLAIPYTVGPGTVGTLLVMGATAADWKMRGIEMAGITAAVLLIGCLLYFCERMEAILKRQGLEILTKLTGLFLAALAAQLILSALHTVIHGS